MQFRKDRRMFSRKAVFHTGIAQSTSRERAYFVQQVIVDDISLGGVKVTVSCSGHFQSIKVNDLFELIYPDDRNEKPLVFTCAVRRIHKNGSSISFGARFLDCSLEDFQVLACMFIQEMKR